MRRKLLIGMFVICFGITGCQQSPQESEPKEITILYSSVSDFQRDFDSVYDKFKDVHIEVVEYSPQLGRGMWNNMKYVPQHAGDWDGDAYLEIVRDNRPDLLFFPQDLYPVLYEQNVLTNLSPYLTEDDLAGIEPDIVAAFQEMGNGSIYAMSDTISAQVLYFNKDVFNQMGVSQPADVMSWEELFQTSNRFSSEPELSGLYLPFYDSAWLLLQMGKTEGLKWYDPVGETTLFDSSGWRTVIKQLMSYLETEAKQATNGTDANSTEEFLNGRVAMTLDSYRLIYQLQDNEQKINWGIAPGPVDSDTPGVSRTKSFQYLHGISKYTDDQETSLEVLKYINSELSSRLKSNLHLNMFTIPVRSSVLNQGAKGDLDLSAFNKLKPEMLLEVSPIPRIQETRAMREIGRILQRGVNEDLTVDQVIMELQEGVIRAMQEPDN